MLKALCRLACLLLLLPAAEPTIAEGDSRPNIVLVLADDLEAGTLPNFPNITQHLVGPGASFERFFVTNSWCCPSRASILRSQHVHSHGVLTNTAPEGGFQRFHEQGLERSTIGTWMRQAGYRTALMGKFLNHYPGKATPETYVPPGWDDWAVPVRALYEEYGYALNENGTVLDYGWEEQDYLSDVLARKARDFITGSGDKPFFLYLAPVGPHNPANPAYRHEEAFESATAPRTPSFNQADVSAEPLWLRSRPPLTPADEAEIDERHRSRLRAMLGVDDLVGAVVRALEESGELDDTYIFFTSDNGFHLGTHRLKQGKTTPYEEAIRVPLVVRGPGVKAGTIPQLGATIDLAPTFAELGGATVPAFAEGRSLVPLLRGRPPSQWRRHVLVEFTRPANRTSARQTPVPAYRALRTERHAYVEYETGERQLYDLHTDPYQLRNLAAGADPGLLRGLAARLAGMAACAGAGCRQADRRE
ncbi:sulfatase family protein [Nonomuraea candida]|uniref:sulfatase family protein n=1 Tax=Nonomuraea candida TaxID=359159 RepID=UPI000B0F40B8|nr:sulfatase [Nonomuraea candida]